MQDTLLAAWQGLGGFEGRCLAAHLAVQDRDQPLPQRAAHREPAARPGSGTSRESSRRSRPGSARPSGSSRTPMPCSRRRGPACRPAPRPATSRPNPSPSPSWPPCRCCRRASSRCSSCATSSGSAPARWRACSTRPSNRSTARSSGPAPACSAASRARSAAPPPAPGSPAEDADRRAVHQRLRVCRPRRAGGAADRRRLHVDAAHAARIRGPGPGGRLLRPPVRRGPRRSTWCRPAPTASPRSAPT